MSRLHHHFEIGAAYAITSVTSRRCPIFSETTACRFFITCMEYQKQILGFKIYGFVIMPDHIHCVFHPGTVYPLTEIMRRLKGNFARSYHIMQKMTGVLWQRGYYESGIRTPHHLMTELAYLHNNPVRAGLVSAPGEYEFSSFRYYYGSQYKNIIDPIA